MIQPPPILAFLFATISTSSSVTSFSRLNCLSMRSRSHPLACEPSDVEMSKPLTRVSEPSCEEHGCRWDVITCN